MNKNHFQSNSYCAEKISFYFFPMQFTFCEKKTARLAKKYTLLFKKINSLVQKVSAVFPFVFTRPGRLFFLIRNNNLIQSNKKWGRLQYFSVNAFCWNKTSLGSDTPKYCKAKTPLKNLHRRSSNKTKTGKLSWNGVSNFDKTVVWVDKIGKWTTVDDERRKTTTTWNRINSVWNKNQKNALLANKSIFF